MSENILNDEKVREYLHKLNDFFFAENMQGLELVQALWESYQFIKRTYGVELDECSPFAVKLKASMDAYFIEMELEDNNCDNHGG